MSDLSYLLTDNTSIAHYSGRQSKQFDEFCMLDPSDLSGEDLEQMFKLGETMLFKCYGSQVKAVAREICLEFYIRLVSKLVPKTNPHKYFYNLARSQLRNESRGFVSNFGNDATVPSVVDESDEHLRRRDVIRKAMNGLPKHLRINFLYIIQYPEHLEKVIKRLSMLDQYAIYVALDRVRKFFNKLKVVDENLMPKSNASHLAMLAAVYKLSPELLAMFASSKSLASFYQIAKILGGKTIEFPDFSDLCETIDQSVDVARKIEDDRNRELSTRDRETIAAIMTSINGLEELGGDVQILPFIEDYINSVVSGLAETHSKLQQRLVDNVDVKNMDAVASTYEVLNREMKTQVRLISEIVSTLTTLGEVKAALKAFQVPA